MSAIADQVVLSPISKIGFALAGTASLASASMPIPEQNIMFEQVSSYQVCQNDVIYSDDFKSIMRQASVFYVPHTNQERDIDPEDLEFGDDDMFAMPVATKRVRVRLSRPKKVSFALIDDLESFE